MTLSTGKYSAFRDFGMKFAELYEVSERYIEELERVTEYGSIQDALLWLGEKSKPYGGIYKDPLLAAWFKKHADPIAEYAVREIRNEEPLGIRYEATVITNAGIDLPDRTLTWYIRNMMPELSTKLTRMADRNPSGAANGMVGLKKYHDIDVKRYVNPETIIRIITDCIIHKEIGAAISTLKIVIGDDPTVSMKYLNAHKSIVVKSLLINMREGDEWDREVIKDAVNNLLSMGITWPDLKVLQTSLYANKK
jgi:hypothetical protein